MRTISIDTALAPRLALVAQAMAERVAPGAWEGYRATEGLVTNLTRPSELGGNLAVAAHRPSNPLAQITLGFVSMVDIRDESSLASSVIEDGITEEEIIEEDIPAGVEEERVVEKEFETTQSWSEALQETFKSAWEAGGKASLSVEYAGVKGALEAFGKYGEDKVRQSSSSRSGSTRTRDFESQKFTVKGPAKFKLRAYRSRKREQRIIRARCDFDGKIYWDTGSTEPGVDRVWEFTTFKTQFLPVARRTIDDSVYGYREFRDNPLSDAELDAIEARPDKLIEIPVQFDTITSKSLTQV